MPQTRSQKRKAEDLTVDTESPKKKRSDDPISPTTSEESYKNESDSSSEDESYDGETDSEDDSYLVKFLNDQILKEQDSTDQIMNNKGYNMDKMITITIRCSSNINHYKE